MSRIVTFYSYKGGVGRTFALANVAVLLAKRGKSVLVIDWDLEAPGLHRYFRSEMLAAVRPQLGLIHLLTASAGDPGANWESFVESIYLEEGIPISLLSSGDQAPDYAEKVRAFSWSSFFEKRRGGAVLERWRTEWKGRFDFVIIDSRTGITDSGGVCTVLLPDILVLVFSANEQSFEGGLRVALGVQEARQRLDVPRPPAIILPLPNRFDGRDEVDEAKKWLDRFGTQLKPFYDDWLPKQFQPRQMLELTKVPYVTKFSFGEPLAVLTHGVTDPEFPGFYLENVARLLTSDFRDAAQILAPTLGEAQLGIAEFRAQLARVPLDEAALEKALTLALKDLPAIGRAEVLNEAGAALLRQGHFNSAERHLHRALALSEKELGAGHPTFLSSLNFLAELLKSTNRLFDAEAIYRRVLDELLKSLGHDHPTVAVAFRNLATVLRRLSRLDEAASYYREAINVLERTVGSDDPALALAYDDLGVLLRRSGRLQEAEQLYRRAIDRMEYAARPGDPALTKNYSNLATLLQQSGRLEEAEHLYRQTIDRLEQWGRLDDPAFGRTYNNLARLLQRSGRLDEAEHLYRRAIDRLEGFERPDYPAIARTYDGLGALLRRSGRLGEAEHLYQRAIDRLEGAMPHGDAAVTRVQNSLASLLQQVGRLEEAEHVYRRAIAGFESAGRSSHSVIHRTYYDLGALLQKFGRFDEAEYVYYRAIEGFERAGRPSDVAIARIYDSLATRLQQTGRTEEAELVYRQAIDRLAARIRLRDPVTIRVYENYAKLLRRSDRADEATEILLRMKNMQFPA